MAGIYVHIPFCRKACHYCNFHFSTSLQQQSRLVGALLKEISDRSSEGGDYAVETVYFGGGTPSILSETELQALMDAISAHYRIVDGAEITLEANPDDLSPKHLASLKQCGINRLSIGVQTFRDDILHQLNRSHVASQSDACLALAADAGFDNINADLIYGIPGLTDEDVKSDIDRLIHSGVKHLSAYALTVEEGTALAHFVHKGRYPNTDDDQALRQFRLIRQRLKDAGMEHYEISNWALSGYRSRHNAAYWQQQSYIGFGPGAHSYNGRERSWNIANNSLYIRAIEAGDMPREREVLTSAQHYNEYVMTALRTIEGFRPEHVKEEAHRKHFLQHVARYVDRGLMEVRDGAYCLTQEGQFLADGIAADLFI